MNPGPVDTRKRIFLVKTTKKLAGYTRFRVTSLAHAGYLTMFSFSSEKLVINSITTEKVFILFSLMDYVYMTMIVEDVGKNHAGRVASIFIHMFIKNKVPGGEYSTSTFRKRELAKSENFGFLERYFCHILSSIVVISYKYMRFDD